MSNTIVNACLTSDEDATFKETSSNTFIQQSSNTNCMSFFLYGLNKYILKGRYYVGRIPVFSSSDTGFIVPFMFEMNAYNAL